MITIAAGVCLGIVAAVIVLNWWQAHLVRREERRERKAYRRMARAYEKVAQEAEYRARHEAAEAAWQALKAKPSRPPEPSTPAPRDNVLRADIIFWSIIAVMVFGAIMNGLGYH